MTHRCKHCQTELQDVRVDGLSNDAHENKHLYEEAQKFQFLYEVNGVLERDDAHAVHDWGRCRNILRERLSALRAAVIAYIERFNLEHEHLCPEDDTCDCPVVQNIEKALKEGA